MIAYRDNAQVIVEIKKLMLDSNITHREVAERIGLSPQAFNKLLNKKNFGFEDAQRIVQAVGYSLTFGFAPSVIHTHSVNVENHMHYLPDKEKDPNE